MDESVSLGRFVVRALIAVAVAAGLLLAAGHLGAGGVALMAVAEAAVVVGLLHISRRPLEHARVDGGAPSVGGPEPETVDS